MYLFVGLGNPGDEYVGTPHNAGFRFVENLREFFGWDSLYDIDNWQYDKYLKADISIGKMGVEKKLIFLKPMGFMNLSGASVHEAVKKYDLDVRKDIVLGHDDLDIPLGKYKIQLDKSPKAHKGVDSVHRHVGANLLHVRIGVENRGELRDKIPGDEYVLKKYSEDELKTLDETIADSSRGIRKLLEI